ncbi:MAG: alanine racemase [Actinomycetota bacterium]
MTGFTPEEISRRGHPIWAEVDLAAISHNITELKARASGAEVMGVVKGYAYGHGNPASALAMLAGGATRLGVARVAEALHLRDAGVAVPIHVFSEPPPDAAAALVDKDITATIYTSGFARALSGAAAAAGRRVPVHVKLDTGMHRVGLQEGDLADAVRELRSLPGLEIEGAWSHLAVADQLGHPFTRKQLDLFHDLVRRVEGDGIRLRYKHIANSAATLAMPESHLDLVRCGIAAYGLWPAPDFVGTADLHPAMTLRARISMVKEVPAGDAVSYGLNYELERASRVVTVSAGYADGYDRRLSGTAEILIRGERHTVSGTVCMDQFMVDVGDRDVAVGDVVTLLGRDGSEEIRAEELADLIGTINYEVTTRIPSRVPRIYREGSAA